VKSKEHVARSLPSYKSLKDELGSAFGYWRASPLVAAVASTDLTAGVFVAKIVRWVGGNRMLALSHPTTLLVGGCLMLVWGERSLYLNACLMRCVSLHGKYLGGCLIGMKDF
jgi:hypothetical protein